MRRHRKTDATSGDRARISGQVVLSTVAETVQLADASGFLVHLADGVATPVGSARAWFLEWDGYVVVEAGVPFDIIEVGPFRRPVVRAL